MSLDLDQIRSRLASMDGCDLTPKYLGWDDWCDYFCECGPFTIGTNDRVQIPPSAVFVSNAPTDIADLLSEVERLRAENEGLRTERPPPVAVCPDCGEVTRCDEDRCCVSCGRDLIILADRHSADLLIELIGENAEPPEWVRMAEYMMSKGARFR